MVNIRTCKNLMIKDLNSQMINISKLPTIASFILHKEKSENQTHLIKVGPSHPVNSIVDNFNGRYFPT